MKKMMKKTIFLWSLLLLVSSYDGGALAATWKDSQGAYVGLGGGYGYADFHSDFASAGGSLETRFSAHPDNGFGWMYLGYGEVFRDRYYIGAELSLGLWAGTSSGSSGNISPTLNQARKPNAVEFPEIINARFAVEPKQDISIYSRFGYLLPDLRGLLYGIIGWTYGVQNLSLSTDTFTYGGETYAASQNDSIGLSSFTYGAGFETAIAKDFSVRIQYRYIDFGSNGSLNISGLEGIVKDGSDLRLRAGSGSSNHVFGLGASYFF